MRDNRFNGVGGGMNRRIGCVLIFFGLYGYRFQSLDYISFGFGLFCPWSESFCLNKVLFILHSSRVYYPCILGVEMLEICISLASPLLALHGGWEAGIMNKHIPIMDTLPTNVVSSRKRIRANDSSDDESQHEDDVIEFDPNWKLIWPRFIVLSPQNESQQLTKLSPFAVEKMILEKFGTVNKVTKMRSGSLLIEATRPAQARNILDTTSFMDIDVKATPHRSLNTSKGVIKDHGRDLYDMSEMDIVSELRDQGVEGVSRFILKKDGKEIKTNTLFITFATPTPPAKLKRLL